MALVEEPPQGKRPHVKTEKMLDFLKTQEEQHKNLSCPIEGCSKVLTSYPGLKYHIKRMHEPQNEFTCSHCQRSFKSANGLRYHCMKGKCGEPGKRSDSTSDEDFECTQTDLQHEHGAQSSEEEKLTKRKIPPALDLSNLNGLNTPGIERLTEFAIIATSPLVQRAPVKPWDSPRKQLSQLTTVEDNNRTVKSEQTSHVQDNVLNRQNSTDKNGNYCPETDEALVTSTSQTNNDGVWSHQWPKAVWQCFIAGTKVCIGFIQWEDVEQVALQESIAQKAAGLSGQRFERLVAPNGLRLVEIRKFAKLDNINNSLVHLYFTPDVKDQLDMCAECVIDHPFFVSGKGWCSNDPILTERHYGIPCNKLEINDVCLPPSYSQTFETTSNYDGFTLMDKSAVYTLSTMAQKSSPKKTAKGSPTKKRQIKTDQTKPKRPPNAFMLFAKDHREEYTQKFPGKDNRAISVLLGEEWHKMTNDCRVEYVEKAQQIAEEQKKIHPDCWKRKK